MKKKMTPVDVVIKTFGGPSEVAYVTGITASAVLKWKPLGLVPSKYQADLLLEAKYLGKKLTPRDLIYGRVK